jgi:SPP1 gp7 family putative phage head morphogenesis protein
MRDRFINRRARDIILAKGADDPVKELRRIQKLHKNWATSLTNTMGVATYNATIDSEWIYTAVLDDRTTEFCRAHHGRIYEKGKGPVPPNHINCRSVAVPLDKHNENINTVDDFINILSEDELNDFYNAYPHYKFKQQT